MSWIELSLDTTHEAVDWACTLLANAIAAEDIQIHEYSALQADTFQADTLQADRRWTFTIRLYLLEDAHIYQRIDAIAFILKPLHRTGMTSELQKSVIDQKPPEVLQNLENSLIRRIGDRFVVISANSGYQIKNPQEIILRLQNSLAFGSGLHPATILSLQLLERHVKPLLHTLDLGSGSGILSVAIAKLGATVLAVDNDPIAVSATEDAVQRNHVAQSVITMCGSLGAASKLGHWMGGNSSESVPAIAADAQFDLIVANIFARVHISLAVEFYEALQSTAKHSGILITSGYTNDREEDITLAMSTAGFTVCDREQLNEWSAMSFYKPNKLNNYKEMVSTSSI